MTYVRSGAYLGGVLNTQVLLGTRAWYILRITYERMQGRRCCSRDMSVRAGSTGQRTRNEGIYHITVRVQEGTRTGNRGDKRSGVRAGAGGPGPGTVYRRKQTGTPPPRPIELPDERECTLGLGPNARETRRERKAEVIREPGAGSRGLGAEMKGGGRSKSEVWNRARGGAY